MEKKETPAKTASVSLALLAYTENGLNELDQLVTFNGAETVFSKATADLADYKGKTHDLVLALYDGTRDITSFTRDIARLKIVKKIPLVMSLAEEEFRPNLESSKSELAADDLFFLPMNPAEFSKILMTRIATLQIARDRTSKRVDPNKSARNLGEILVDNRIIDVLQLKKALDYQKRTGLRLGDALVELGFIDEEQKMHFLASQLGVALATPRQYAAADLNVVALIPEHIARRHTCIALEKNGNELQVAMTDVLDLRLLDSLRDSTDLTITPLLGLIDDITTSIDRYYRDIASHKDASNLMADLGDKVEYVQERQEQINLEEMVAAGAELGIVRLVNMLVSNAVRDRASDIHIEPMENELVVRYRIDGDLRRVMSPPLHSHQAIITRIKILSNLNIAERRLPQDGRMVVKMGNREIDIRVSVLPSVYGEKVVLRILDKEAFEKSVANLGFAQHEQNIFKAQILKPHGMIVVTGPTGSGKSTTLYSALQSVKNVTRNIITVEDPVEFHMEGITQVHVNSKIGLTFGTALRSILRQDPDIVLIGEIRDDETADIAIKMALTGHLVFSTLHTNDAAGAIARFVDIGVPPLLLGSSLNCIIAQRLVRRVCPKCKIAYDAPAEMIEELHITQSGPVKFYKGEGCVSCNGTGFYGRTGIFEMLVVTKEMRTMIIKNAPTMELQELAEKQGMRTLRRSGIELALRGETTIEQVIAVTTEM